MLNHFQHQGEVAVSNLIVVQDHVIGWHRQGVVCEEKEAWLVEKDGIPQILIQVDDQRVFLHFYLQFLIILDCVAPPLHRVSHVPAPIPRLQFFRVNYYQKIKILTVAQSNLPLEHRTP